MSALLSDCQELAVPARVLERSPVARWLLGAVVLAMVPPLASPAAAEEESLGLNFELGARVMHDDNIYRLPSDIDPADTPLGSDATRDDLIARASAAAQGRWALGRQMFAMAATAAADRYSSNDFLDNTSGTGAADWDWQLGHKWSGSAGARYERALSGFTQRRFFARDLFETLDYHGEVRYSITPRWRLNAKARHAQASHDNFARRADDSENRSGAFGLECRTRAANRFGWEYRRARATFRRNDSLLASGRDYEESTASFNLDYALTAKTALMGSAGYLRRDYPQDASQDFSGEVWTATLRWLPAAKTQLMATAWRELKAYVDAESDHFVARGVGIAASWTPTRKVALSLQLSRESQAYLGAPQEASLDSTRRDALNAGQVSVSYAPRRLWSLDISYRQERRDSTRALFDYDGRSVSLESRFRF